jgi:hypothetical protein
MKRLLSNVYYEIINMKWSYYETINMKCFNIKRLLWNVATIKWILWNVLLWNERLPFWHRFSRHMRYILTAIKTNLERSFNSNQLKISVGLGPARASPRAFFTARPETGPGRAVKNPARPETGPGRAVKNPARPDTGPGRAVKNPARAGLASGRRL